MAAKKKENSNINSQSVPVRYRSRTDARIRVELKQNSVVFECVIECPVCAFLLVRPRPPGAVSLGNPYNSTAI